MIAPHEVRQLLSSSRSLAGLAAPVSAHHAAPNSPPPQPQTHALVSRRGTEVPRPLTPRGGAEVRSLAGALASLTREVNPARQRYRSVTPPPADPQTATPAASLPAEASPSSPAATPGLRRGPL